MKMYDPIKRFLDLLISIPLAIALIPLQAIIASLVWATMGKPVLFHQDRPGRQGKIFSLTKFRSMREPRYVGEPDGERMTQLGSLLRSTSLDELPSLWNVVRGDMSFVGPRPLLVHYLPLYNSTQFRRHEVRPGITGLAQVSGRNATSWEERFRWDIEYVNTRTLALDARILWRTVSTVIKREGISAKGDATMPAFTGNGGSDET